MIAQGYDLDNVTSLLNCTTRTTDTTMRTVNITASSTGQVHVNQIISGMDASPL